MTPHDPRDLDRDHVRPPRLVRSYTLTAARTRADVDLPLEATLRRQGFDDETGETPRQRILRVCDTRSVAEVSAVLGIPVGTVKSRMSHARQQLAAALDGTRT